MAKTATYFSHLSDGEIKDFVINYRKESLQQNLNTCNWLIFCNKIRLIKGNLERNREWRNRVRAIIKSN